MHKLRRKRLRYQASGNYRGINEGVDKGHGIYTYRKSAEHPEEETSEDTVESNVKQIFSACGLLQL